MKYSTRLEKLKTIILYLSRNNLSSKLVKSNIHIYFLTHICNIFKYKITIFISYKIFERIH